eukprot:TRINITY_DN3461_c0_g1_i2.p1 TRINITY_DN3461_c0_g1~~TRINITY_DN3461_c0_g1_i2.p1  ORF type:complete len:237 (+),score=36.68 TRINITY_DN3461_c0_g1_i2:136-846(+)
MEPQLDSVVTLWDVLDHYNYKEHKIEEETIAFCMKECLHLAESLLQHPRAEREHFEFRCDGLLLNASPPYPLPKLRQGSTYYPPSPTTTTSSSSISSSPDPLRSSLRFALKSIVSGGIVGTPYFTSPEIILGTGAAGEERALMWSLGITALELAHGEPPFVRIHPMRAIFLIAYNPPPTLTGRYSREFHDFVSRVLTISPKERMMVAEGLRHPFILAATERGGYPLQEFILPDTCP